MVNLCFNYHNGGVKPVCCIIQGGHWKSYCSLMFSARCLLKPQLHVCKQMKICLYLFLFTLITYKYESTIQQCNVYQGTIRSHTSLCSPSFNTHHQPHHFRQSSGRTDVHITLYWNTGWKHFPHSCGDMEECYCSGYQWKWHYCIQWQPHI